jgi:hypothetical protein
MITFHKKSFKVRVGRPSNNDRLSDILHNLNPGEYLITDEPDAYRLAGSISRTTKKYGVRLSVASSDTGLTAIEAVQA